MVEQEKRNSSGSIVMMKNSGKVTRTEQPPIMLLPRLHCQGGSEELWLTSVIAILVPLC